MMELSKDIGICKVDREGNIIELDRGPYGQGYVFKSLDAYKNKPEEPCYVAELSDTVYTAKDFLEMCNNQKEFADMLFEGVDWQHPGTLLEEQFREGEWEECQECGFLIDRGAGRSLSTCPRCGGKNLGRLGGGA